MDLSYWFFNNTFSVILNISQNNTEKFILMGPSVAFILMPAARTNLGLILVNRPPLKLKVLNPMFGVYYLQIT